MKMYLAASALVLALIPAIGLAQLEIQAAREESGESVIVRFEATAAQTQEPSAEETPDPEATAEPDSALLAANAMIEARFSQEKAAQMLARGTVILQEGALYQDEKVASMAVIWQGVQADGTNGCSAAALSIDLETGEEIRFDALFLDPDAAAAAMEAIIEADVLASMSDYMEYAELLPMPRDCFSFDENGLTVYYPDDRYRYFGGRSGSVHFAWYELADYIGEESPVYALAQPQAGSRQDIEAQLGTGAFGGVMPFGLTDRLGDALSALTLLADPDYTTTSMVYLFEEAALRGWALEIPRYADTEEEDTPICAVRTSRISFHGLTTGRTLRAEIVALLGEPEQTRSYDGDTAQDLMLSPGESLVYELGGYVLEAHLDESGVLSSLILRTSMPERLY